LQDQLFDWPRSFGATVFALAALRLLWRLGHPPPPEPEMPGWMRIGAWLSDRAGRRATLGSFSLAGIVVVLAATQLALSDAALLALTPVLGIFALGIYSAIGPVLTEIYPTPLRGSGLGFCYNIGRGIAGITPLAVGGSIAALGFSHAIGLYVAASYAVVLLATTLLAETRGRDLVGQSNA